MGLSKCCTGCLLCCSCCCCNDWLSVWFFNAPNSACRCVADGAGFGGSFNCPLPSPAAAFLRIIKDTYMFLSPPDCLFRFR
uniref:Putative secreted protein n=1 Tax=Panstrongylus lignarius TaxID=156445 RepID=A0A224Y392_9HEMI